MYHGEVNVEHCQLSALLKTAESLKVKGLTDMTNLGPPPPHLGTQAQSQHATCYSTSSSSAPASCKTETIDVVAPEQTEPTELVNKKPPPSTSASTNPPQAAILDPMATAATTTCPTTATTTTTSLPASSGSSNSISLIPQQQYHATTLIEDTSQNSNKDSVASPRGLLHSPQAGSSVESETMLHRDDDLDEDEDEDDEDDDDYKPSDMRLTSSSTAAQAMHDNGNNSIGSSCNAALSGHGGNGAGAALVNPLAPQIGRLPSPQMAGSSGEPIAGPSNMPPVQQVPLSLKKEVDWGGGSADEKSNLESPTDYPRHSLDPDPDGVLLTAAGSPAHLYQCIYCNTAFPHQSKLTRHILSHSLETLKYREQLQHPQHPPLPPLPPDITPGPPLNLMESHFSGLRPPDPTDHPPTPMDLDLTGGEGPGVVLCKFCGKSFPDVGSLIGHLPVHTGDRPFKCEFCGKAFKLRHHMKDHCRVHTGERPFRCSLCGKTFSRSTILKAHEKTHYPKYVRKFLSPSPLDTEEESPH